METKLAPELIERITKGELRQDWKAVGERVKAREGLWQLVAVTERSDRGIAKEIRERLQSAGCKAQVIALLGINGGARPWQGWAVFARILR